MLKKQALTDKDAAASAAERATTATQKADMEKTATARTTAESLSSRANAALTALRNTKRSLRAARRTVVAIAARVNTSRKACDAARQNAKETAKSRLARVEALRTHGRVNQTHVTPASVAAKRKWKRKRKRQLAIAAATGKELGRMEGRLMQDQEKALFLSRAVKQGASMSRAGAARLAHAFNKVKIARARVQELRNKRNKAAERAKRKFQPANPSPNADLQCIQNPEEPKTYLLMRGQEFCGKIFTEQSKIKCTQASKRKAEAAMCDQVIRRRQRGVIRKSKSRCAVATSAVEDGRRADLDAALTVRTAKAQCQIAKKSLLAKKKDLKASKDRATHSMRIARGLSVKATAVRKGQANGTWDAANKRAAAERDAEAVSTITKAIQSMHTKVKRVCAKVGKAQKARAAVRSKLTKLEAHSAEACMIAQKKKAERKAASQDPKLDARAQLERYNRFAVAKHRTMASAVAADETSSKLLAQLAAKMSERELLVAKIAAAELALKLAQQNKEKVRHKLQQIVKNENKKKQNAPAVVLKKAGEQEANGTPQPANGETANAVTKRLEAAVKEVQRAKAWLVKLRQTLRLLDLGIFKVKQATTSAKETTARKEAAARAAAKALASIPRICHTSCITCNTMYQPDACTQTKYTGCPSNRQKIGWQENGGKHGYCGKCHSSCKACLQPQNPLKCTQCEVGMTEVGFAKNAGKFGACSKPPPQKPHPPIPPKPLKSPPTAANAAHKCHHSCVTCRKPHKANECTSCREGSKKVGWENGRGFCTLKLSKMTRHKPGV